MTIGEFFEFIMGVVNKYQSGSYEPDQFNNALKATYLVPLKVKLGLPEDFQFPQHGIPTAVARQEFQNSQIISDDIANLVPTVMIPISPSGYFTRPTDYIRYSMSEYDLITVQYSTFSHCDSIPPPILEPIVETVSIEPVTDAVWAFRQSNSIIMPEPEYPIIRFGQSGFQVAPPTVKNIRLTYVRKPAVPVFGFTVDVSTGDYIYDPTTSTEIEYNEIMHLDYAVIMLKYIGANLSNQQIIDFAESIQKGGQ
jgi:hypothetical protein